MRSSGFSFADIALLCRSSFEKIWNSKAPLNQYLKAIAGLRKPLFKHVNISAKSIRLYRCRDLNAGDYQLGLLFVARNSSWGAIVGIDGAGNEVFRCPIDSNRRYERILFTTKADGEITFHYEAIAPSDIIFIAAGIRQLTLVRSVSVIDITEDTVCACLASYPPREKLLKETIDSLTHQVDHLFLYLNNYRQVPAFIVNHRHRSKIHYVLDTKSEYRAAAKFYFLKDFSCFWLVCDDDIIYPNNYREIVIPKLILNGTTTTIVGIHATIFQSTISHYFNSVKELMLFEQKNSNDRTVHMLGTGTLALHSSILENEDLDRLLAHPTENDETLAIICKEKNIKQVALSRAQKWLRSNPKMKTGLFEETMESLKQQQKLIAILNSAGEWSDLD